VIAAAASRSPNCHRTLGKRVERDGCGGAGDRFTWQRLRRWRAEFIAGYLACKAMACANSWRECTPNVMYTRARWDASVRSPMRSSSPIALALMPGTASATTSLSRPVSEPGPIEAATAPWPGLPAVGRRIEEDLATLEQNVAALRDAFTTYPDWVNSGVRQPLETQQFSAPQRGCAAAAGRVR
jgi:hypothetical protein